MGMFTRALAYIMSHGADGLKQVAEDAVLNANYVMAALKDVMSPAFEGPCMHEALFDDSFLKDTGVSTLDFAKAMIDEGYHPMTMYFPLVVHGAMLIEPTESRGQGGPRPVHRRAAFAHREGQDRHRGRGLQGRAALRAAPPPRRDAGRPQADPALEAVEQSAGHRSAEAGGGVTGAKRLSS